ERAAGISLDLAADRRGRAAKPSAHRPERLALGKAARNLFPLLAAQRSSGPTAGRRRDAPVRSNHAVHTTGDPVQCSRNLALRLAATPALPHLILLSPRQPWSTHTPHSTLLGDSVLHRPIEFTAP